MLYASIEYGGMEFPIISYLQDEMQIEYWLKQLRWNKTVGGEVWTTLERAQSRSG